jgi:prolyl-tRNA editing enzyme YbaK/EbsC (Cys-tRNA(Pro) deacylase)/ribosomal protein S18 acetylase RimI-like enzyme
MTSERDVTIRPAVEADAAALAGVYLDSAEHHIGLDPGFYHKPDEGGVAEAIARAMAAEDTAVLLAEVGGRVAGFVQARLMRAPEAANMIRPQLSAEVGIAVLRGDRQRGLGTALMAAAEDWAVAHGAHAILLNCHAANRGAIRMYEKLGYRTLGLLMQKPLSATAAASQPGGPAGAGSGLSPAARRVQQALAQRGFSLEVVELPRSTRTAAEAAAAVGCGVGQIAKSIVFRGVDTGRPVLVIAAGDNRVNEAVVAEQLGEPLAKADADFVRARTGYVIGGVPPVGHAEPLPTFVDEDLLAQEAIWAAAGTPNAVFKLTPQQLISLTQARVARVRADNR